MLLFAPYLMFFFSGNVTNFPAVLQPSSTCQWFRLLTVCCQRFTNQPIVFCVVRPTLNSLALAKRAVSLFSSRAAALVSRVSRLRRSRARALLSLNLKKKRDCSQSRIIPLSRKNLVNVRRNQIKTKCGKERLNNLGMRQKRFLFVSGKTFF